MVQRQKQSRFTQNILFIILLIWAAFALRLLNIDTFGFWTDEGLTPLRASYPLAQILRNEIIIQNFVGKDTHPPLYYLIVHLTRPFWGETDFAYRYSSVLAGILLVPVLYQFGRRLNGRFLGLLAATLIAINPLQIWYANEARMYALFVLLLALASYVLWRALSGASLVRSLGLYMLLAGLAFYTHYTAVFLIAAQALFWVWLLWQHGMKKWIVGAVVVGILAAIPLIPFTIPRLFSGKEANFFYVSPWIMLQDVVRFFNLGLTVDFNQNSIKLLNLLVAGLAALGLIAARTWRCRAFLLSYLMAVVFGLMLGSILFKPMYQGVRHIMAGSPAFILLLAWGVVFLWQQAQRQTAVRWAWAAGGILSLFIVLIGPVIALHNLYNKPEIYAKDDFRHLIAQIEAEAGSNDVIVYNNAIHLPLHEHYGTRQDIAVTAVPVYPTQASITAIPDLTRLAEQYERIWFVTDPPADNRDDDHLAQQWLTTNLLQVGGNRAHARTTIVESLTFATAPSAVDSLPQNGRMLSIQWPDLPALHAVQLDTIQPALWFNLYWDTATPLPEAKVRFSLQDSSGQEWAADIQPLVKNKTRTDTPTAYSRIPYQFPLPTGLPPGQYILSAQPLAADSITPLGDSRPLIELSTNPQPPPPHTKWPHNQQIFFNNGLQLLGWEMGETEVRPGHNLPLTLYWQTDTPVNMENIEYELAVVHPDGTLLRTQSDPPGADWLTSWPAAAPIMERTGLYFRPETEPGTYQLRWQLRQDDAVIAGRPYWQPWPRESIILGEVTVIPWPLNTTLPTAVTRTDAAFGPIDLYGYTLGQPNDNQLTLTLHWRAQSAPDSNNLLFVHLVDEAGHIIAQEDRVPGNTLRPTSGWRANEVISDTVTLTLPTDTAPGSYSVRLGFYNPDTAVRLPATLQGQPQPDDQVDLATVTLP